MHSSNLNSDPRFHTSNDNLIAFTDVFDKLINQYIAESNEDNQGLKTYYEPDWQSPCIVQADANINSTESGALLTWSPYLRQANGGVAVNLANIEQALEVQLPIQVHALFCRYFSHDINAVAQQGGLTILQAWNEEDFERLQKNLIAHVLMKRRLKQPDTIFFALTDEDDLLISVLLETGEVVLEVVGKEPHQVLSPNLTDFMTLLTPKPVLVSL